ncbi:MAG: glycerol-3-phosphate acyltransferase, partial [Planctomycetota bacterium]
MTPFILLIGFAYLLGAVPFGFLIAKAHGKDLRTIGSGNIGATNTVRALGKKWGIFCFVLDVLKGLIPMLLVPMLGAVGAKTAGPSELTLWLTVGCTAVLGHIFPIYLKFKGGKGVATSLGIVLGLFPFYTLCGVGAFAIWLITLLIWRYVS